MDKDLSFDLVVVGAGPGGYVAAIRAAQLGLKVGLVEKENHFGGTCLNWGCIPSKALLHSTEVFHFIHEHGKRHGILCSGLKADLNAIMAHKQETLDKLRGGVKQLIAARKITSFKGLGSLTSPTTLTVNGQTLTTKHFVLSTGSIPVELPFLKFNGKTIISSNEAISLTEVPQKLVVVGAGAIGLEMASVWKRLGSDVTIVELLPRVAPTCDEEIAKTAEKIFKKQGIHFELGCKVTGTREEKGQLYLIADKNGQELTIPADKILVAIGRKPFTENLGLEKVGIQLDAQKRIPVNEKLQTTIPNIYAIGDIVAGPMLAHKAEEEGIAAVENIAGKHGHMNYGLIPGIIYTSPELASVGISEEEAKAKGMEIKVGKFPMAANGRALASDATDGLVKVIACKKTDKLLGVHIVSHNASELIGSAVVHMEYGGSAEDMARTMTAHPTMTEALKEAALAVDKQAIHAL